MLTGEKSNNPFSRLRHETAIDHQDINCEECDLALDDVFCQELESLTSSTRTEPTKHVFEAKNIVCDRKNVISVTFSSTLLSTIVDQRCSVATSRQRPRNQRPIPRHCEVVPYLTL